MVKTWTFNGVDYQSEWQVRQEVFKKDRITFGAAPEEGKVEFWKKLGVMYAERDYTDEEVAASVRRERDAKLRSTDVYLLPDFPGMTADALEQIKAYRQALRDVPEQTGFPRQIEWPEMPASVAAK